MKTGYEQRPFENPPYSNAYIELPYSERRKFENLIAEKMAEVTLEIEEKPTRVFAPRKSFWPPVDEMEE